MDDWRRRLEDAVRDRAAIQVGRAGRPLRDAVPVRGEAAALLCSVPGHDLHGGEEIVIVIVGGGEPCHLRGTVLRCGVPVPDRGSHGVLLGFLQPAAEPPAPDAAPPAVVLEALVSGGRRIALTAPPWRVVGLSAHQLQLQVPRDFSVVFPVHGALHLRIGASAAAVHGVRGRVETQSTTDTHLLYGVQLDEVEDHQAHAAVVAAVRVALGLG